MILFKHIHVASKYYLIITIINVRVLGIFFEYFYNPWAIAALTKALSTKKVLFVSSGMYVYAKDQLSLLHHYHNLNYQQFSYHKKIVFVPEVTSSFSSSSSSQPPSPWIYHHHHSHQLWWSSSILLSILTSISFYFTEMPPHGPGQSGSTHSHNSEYPDDAWNLYAW